MSKSRVLILEKTSDKVDVTPAAEYGELVYVLDRTTRGAQRTSVFDTSRYEEMLLKRLDELRYDPDEDYVCLAGKVICVSVLCALLAREYGAFKALMFDAHESRYVNRVMGKETVK